MKSQLKIIIKLFRVIIFFLLTLGPGIYLIYVMEEDAIGLIWLILMALLCQSVLLDDVKKRLIVLEAKTKKEES